MSREGSSEDPASPVRASREVIERSEAAQAGDANSEPDERVDKDDPARLADEARQQIERSAAELRKAKVPIETEPPSTYRP